MAKQIYGWYEKDDNFTTLYTHDAIYTIARNTGEWSMLKVGEMSATNHVFTQELLDRWYKEAPYEGTFVLD